MKANSLLKQFDSLYIPLFPAATKTKKVRSKSKQHSKPFNLYSKKRKASIESFPDTGQMNILLQDKTDSTMEISNRSPIKDEQ